MQFNMTSREFDLLFSALAIISRLNADYGCEDLSLEYNRLYDRLKALHFQIRDDIPVDVLYPNAMKKIKRGDSSSRP